MGPSNKYRPEDQLDLVALYWMKVCDAKPEPLSIRVLGKDRDVRLDIAGGSQIPKAGAAAAETAHLLAELRKSWHGVERLLLAYDGSPLSADFLDTVVSFLDPAVSITLLDVAEEDVGPQRGSTRPRKPSMVVQRGAERARALGRHVEWRVARGEAGPEIVRTAVDGKFDAIFMSLRGVYRRGDTTAFASNTRYVLEHAPCRVILGFAPKSIPAQSSPPPSRHVVNPRRYAGSSTSGGIRARLALEPAQQPPPFAGHLRPAELGEPRNKLVPGHDRQTRRLLKDRHERPFAINRQHGNGPVLRITPQSARSGQHARGAHPSRSSGSAANRSTNRSSACRDSRTEL